MITLLTAPLTDAEAAAAASVVVLGLVLGLVAYVVGALGLMGVFRKAGRPGWAAFVPVYNTIVLLQVVGRPLWWFLLLLVPGVNVVVGIVLMNDLATSFGQGAGFTVGLVLLSIVFVYVLWLGPSTYRGPAAGASAHRDAAYAA